jgi:hypothetical protein
MLSNRPLQNLPELRALATRIAVHRLEVTDAEMRAQLRRIAKAGWARDGHKLDPEQSLEVATHVIEECRRLNWQVDLRLFDTACLTFLQWEHSLCKTNWKDLVRICIAQTVAEFREEQSKLSREEQLEAERQIVRKICEEAAERSERIRLWNERTGKSEKAWYRRLREVESPEFGPEVQ